MQKNNFRLLDNGSCSDCSHLLRPTKKGWECSKGNLPMPSPKGYLPCLYICDEFIEDPV